MAIVLYLPFRLLFNEDTYLLAICVHSFETYLKHLKNVLSFTIEKNRGNLQLFYKVQF